MAAKGLSWTHARTHTHARAHTRTHTHTHIYDTHTHTHIHMTHTKYTCTCMRAHKCAHTYTHTHTPTTLTHISRPSPLLVTVTVNKSMPLIFVQPFVPKNTECYRDINLIHWMFSLFFYISHPIDTYSVTELSSSALWLRPTGQGGAHHHLRPWRGHRCQQLDGHQERWVAVGTGHLGDPPDAGDEQPAFSHCPAGGWADPMRSVLISVLFSLWQGA